MTTTKYFFNSTKCHTFSESQAHDNFNDDDEDNDDKNHKDNINDKEDFNGNNKIFFQKDQVSYLFTITSSSSPAGLT